MKHLFISFLVFTVAATSCIETVDDIYLPESEPKIQVTGFISPNSPICIEINKVMPIEYNIAHEYNEPSSFCVENAQVTITNTLTNELVTLAYNQQSKAYTDSTPNFVKINTQYQIIVVVDGFSPLSATTVVPSDQITTLNHQISASNSEEYGYTCGLTIADMLGSDNFYDIQTISYSGSEMYGTSAFRHKNTLITDQGKDGQQIPFSINIERSTLDSAIIHVLSTDENYYKYHITLAANESSNIFTESATVFSNIENGLGVFASFTQKKVVVKP